VLIFCACKKMRRQHVKLYHDLIIIHSFYPLALQPNSGLGRFHESFRFTSVTRSRTVGRTPWTGDQLVARPLCVHKHRKTHTQHKHQTSMPEEGFESTITASKRAKTVHALDRSATVTGTVIHYPVLINLTTIRRYTAQVTNSIVVYGAHSITS
jgi:hypothetical protein